MARGLDARSQGLRDMEDNLTIVQVSDTHLSRTHAWFGANWPAFVEDMRSSRPDFIVNTGDLAFNGPDNPDDLAFARSCHDQLPAPWKAIAGNHDVGEVPLASRLGQPVNDERLTAWRDNLGSPWWTADLDKGHLRMRLIGLDTALMGSEHPDEQQQIAFFESTLAERDGRTVLVFTHMPPFSDDPDESLITTHCILPEPRRWLLDRCVRHGVSAIGSGHLHRHMTREYRGISLVIAPATSFFNLAGVSPSDLPSIRTGYVRWQFDDSGLRCHLVCPDMFLGLDVSNWMEAHRTTTTLPVRQLGQEQI